MTELFEKALAHVRSWPSDRQDEAARILLALDALGDGAYVANADELSALDEALADIEHGNIASANEVAAAFQSFRK